MAMSINTNVGAMVALQSLSATNRSLDKTQFRVTTGLKVNGPKDDAATFAIAQNMRGDIAGIAAGDRFQGAGNLPEHFALVAPAVVDRLVKGHFHGH